MASARLQTGPYGRDHVGWMSEMMWGSPEFFSGGEFSGPGDGNDDGAWKIENCWDDNYIDKFGNYTKEFAFEEATKTNKYTCDDLALELIISFSSKNKIPFVWVTGSGTFNSSDNKYKSKKQFLLAVKKSSGAPDFANNSNTSKLDLNNIKKGVLNVLTSIGNKRPNHIQVIVDVFKDSKPVIHNNYYGTIFMAIQGNFNSLGRIFGSDNPNDSRYLGVDIQSGFYNSKENFWNNISKGEVTYNFLRGHYTNEYRIYNFLSWNK